MLFVLVFLLLLLLFRHNDSSASGRLRGVAAALQVNTVNKKRRLDVPQSTRRNNNAAGMGYRFPREKRWKVRTPHRSKSSFGGKKQIRSTESMVRAGSPAIKLEMEKRKANRASHFPITDCQDAFDYKRRRTNAKASERC